MRLAHGQLVGRPEKGLKGGISPELGLRPPRRGGGKTDRYNLKLKQIHLLIWTNMLEGKGLKGGISPELGLRPPRRGSGKTDGDDLNICNLGKSIC